MPSDSDLTDRQVQEADLQRIHMFVYDQYRRGECVRVLGLR